MLEKGAETVVGQCLKIESDEKVVVLDDGNDDRLVELLVGRVRHVGARCDHVEYEEPSQHGEEPPEHVAEKMKSSDVFIAPTSKSVSHTKARIEANESGARGATMPGVTKKIWRTSLQADYQRVREISEKVYKKLEKTDTISIVTESGTDLKIDVEIESFHKDTGLIHNDGDFGNLPAGEADGGSVNARGRLVVDHLPILPDVEGAVIEIRDNRVKRIENGPKLEKKFESIEGAKNVAEFGFGTNPEAALLGNILNDEKILGTVHVAFGDNSSYFSQGDSRRVSCPIHWDVISENPSVFFDEEKVLDSGNPVFMGSI